MGDPARCSKYTAPATAKAKSGDPVQAQNWGARSASFRNLGFTQWKPLGRFLSRKMTLCRGELWLRWREQSEGGQG